MCSRGRATRTSASVSQSAAQSILFRHMRLAQASRVSARQLAIWRLVHRLELLLYTSGWPARLSRLLGFRPALRIVDHALLISGGAADTPALTVAFASDFHAGFTTDRDLLRRACDALRVVGPDVLLLGGDFVCFDARQIDRLAPLIGQIPAPLGRYAVLGNHDRWTDAEHVTRSLEAAGIQVLINQNRRLPPPFQHIWICGLDDFLSGQPDARATLAGADGVRLVLMHAPSNLMDLQGERFDLALCGHTHGGQIALPGGSPLLVAQGPLSRTYSRGRFGIDHGGVLIVSVGIGCSTVPLRLNSEPEIIVCRMVTVDPTGG
jgi:predicted MPP superfamily phosphohydrolase